MEEKQRFEELKIAINNICELGFEPPQNMVDELSRLENEIIINGELIPTLTSLLDKEFEKFTRDVNLLLKYSPDDGLKISVVHIRSDEENSLRKSYGKISVILHNGRTINGANGSEVLREFVMFAGAENVKSMNLFSNTSNETNIILTKEEYSQLTQAKKIHGNYKSVGSGLFLFTCLSTERKADIICKISENLNLSAKIFVAGKPYNN